MSPGRSPVDVYYVSMQTARAWGTFLRRKWEAGLSVSNGGGLNTPDGLESTKAVQE